MIKYIKYILLLLSFSCIIPANAQEEENIKEELQKEFLDELDMSRKGMFYLVPEFGFWLGTYALVEVAPQLAYHVSDRLSFGLGPHYIYHKNVDFYTGEITKNHMWGVKTFGRFTLIKDAAELLPMYIFDELFAHVEYEKRKVNNEHILTTSTNGYTWIDMFYVGVGINQKAAQFSSYSILLLWNLNNSLSSTSSDFEYRIGLNIYF